MSLTVGEARPAPRHLGLEFANGIGPHAVKTQKVGLADPGEVGEIVHAGISQSATSRGGQEREGGHG